MKTDVTERTEISAQDAAIMQCLMTDARLPVVHVAQQLGLPESTVRHRLGRLVANGVIEFVAQTDPVKLGYSVWVMIGIEVDLPHIDDVARKLADLAEVYFVSATTGGHDLLVAAVFRSNAEFMEFLRNRLAPIRGIRRTLTYNLVNVYKRRHDIVPASEPSAAKAGKSGRRAAAKKKPAS